MSALVAVIAVAVLGCSSDNDARALGDATYLGVALSVPSLSVPLGGSASVEITVSGNHGSPVELSVEERSPGITIAFDHPETTSVALLTVSAAAATTPGSFPITVRARVPSQTVVAFLPVDVPKSELDFSLAASPAKVSIHPGATVPITLSITRSVAFESFGISLHVEGLPAHLTASPLDLGARVTSAVINVTASSTAPVLSTASLFVVAASGPRLSKKVPLEIVVAADAGELDASFGEGGLSFAAFPEGPPRRFLFLKSGKILVLATAGGESGVHDAHARLLRLLPSGVPDPTFGTAGVVDVRIPGRELIASQAIEASTGRIVLVGSSFPTNTGATALTFVGVSADGALDATFGTDGFTLGPSTGMFGVATFDPAGRVVAVGTDQRETRWLVRLGADGLPDSSFGVEGVKVLEAGAAYRPTQLASAGGKVVLLGNLNDRFDVMRIDANGNIDSSFGIGGRATMDYGYAGRDYAGGIAVQPDGKLVVAGTAQVSQYGTACAVARLSASGILDPTFGVDGKAKTSTAAGCQGLALQPDGKILALGSVGAPSNDAAVYRFTASGAVDATFHDGGPATANFGASKQGFSAGEVLPDGRLLALGQTTMYQVGIGIARFWL